MNQLLIDGGLSVQVGNGFPPPQGEVTYDLPLVINRIKAFVTKQ